MNKQTRYVDVEFRSMPEGEEKESRTIAGVAAVFNRETDMGWYVEQIDSHAMDEADLSDVVLCLNHDLNIVLAGTRNGTLRLDKRDFALETESDIIDTTQGNDVLKLVRERLINKMSFCFVVDEDKWEERDGVDYRTITKISRLFDVSLVTFPAYPQTYVGIRSKDDLDELAKEHFKRKEQDKRMEELLSGKDFIERNGSGRNL